MSTCIFFIPSAEHKDLLEPGDCGEQLPRVLVHRNRRSYIDYPDRLTVGPEDGDPEDGRELPLSVLDADGALVLMWEGKVKNAPIDALVRLLGSRWRIFHEYPIVEVHEYARQFEERGLGTMVILDSTATGYER